ncbi:hypothetical protein D9Q98_002830 [Chlorella vulgaris]|uniref:Uncharacterized protein n=2 Tax=Chlorella vulgaris TaxID=3077 RepID=A0A9D4Z041_CHLVU|nr:hypothetical protein D9Q98_002830 [Chlorella vulgaris]
MDEDWSVVSDGSLRYSPPPQVPPTRPVAANAGSDKTSKALGSASSSELGLQACGSQSAGSGRTDPPSLILSADSMLNGGGAVEAGRRGALLPHVEALGTPLRAPSHVSTAPAAGSAPLDAFLVDAAAAARQAAGVTIGTTSKEAIEPRASAHTRSAGQGRCWKRSSCGGAKRRRNAQLGPGGNSSWSMHSFMLAAAFGVLFALLAAAALRATNASQAGARGAAAAAEAQLTSAAAQLAELAADHAADLLLLKTRAEAQLREQLMAAKGELADLMLSAEGQVEATGQAAAAAANAAAKGGVAWIDWVVEEAEARLAKRQVAVKEAGRDAVRGLEAAAAGLHADAADGLRNVGAELAADLQAGLAQALQQLAASQSQAAASLAASASNVQEVAAGVLEQRDAAAAELAAAGRAAVAKLAEFRLDAGSLLAEAQESAREAAAGAAGPLAALATEQELQRSRLDSAASAVDALKATVEAAGPDLDASLRTFFLLDNAALEAGVEDLGLVPLTRYGACNSGSAPESGS